MSSRNSGTPNINYKDKLVKEFEIQSPYLAGMADLNEKVVSNLLPLPPPPCILRFSAPRTR
jgi:hypothetical protein